jgi:hypothetical protein
LTVAPNYSLQTDRLRATAELGVTRGYNHNHQKFLDDCGAMGKTSRNTVDRNRYQVLNPKAIYRENLFIHSSLTLILYGTVLSELYQANLPFIGSGIVVNSSFAREHPETLENILKAVVESIAFVLSPKNKPIVVNTIKTRLRIEDPVLAEEGYQDVLKSLEKNPTPSLEGLRNLHRLLRTRNPSMDKVKPKQLIDDRFMRAALSVVCIARMELNEKSFCKTLLFSTKEFTRLLKKRLTKRDLLKDIAADSQIAVFQNTPPEEPPVH